MKPLKHKSLSLKDVFEIVDQYLNKNFKKPDKAQDPDDISFYKQWDETGTFKGYWVDVRYSRGEDGARRWIDTDNYRVISFDITPYSVRVINSEYLSHIPKYTPGKHNFIDI